MSKMNKITIKAMSIKRLPPLFPLMPNSQHSRIRAQCDLKLSGASPPSATIENPLNLMASQSRTYVASQRTKNSSKRVTGGSAPSNEVHWEGKSGLMTWTISDEEGKRLR